MNKKVTSIRNEVISMDIKDTTYNAIYIGTYEYTENIFTIIYHNGII